MFRLILIMILSAVTQLGAEPLKIAVLHPLLGDLALKIGGDKVQVVDLIGANGDPHHFEPKPENLHLADGASLYLVAGMGLEGYLPKLRAIIPKESRLVEVGATLPAMEGNDHKEGPEHRHEVDPHWWHSIELFGRATGIVAEEMAVASPDDAEFFRKNAAAYRTSLEELKTEIRRELFRIPKDKRHLATAHAAFNYFCKEFGFTPHSVQGLNREQTPDARELAALVKELKDNHVAAIFPETESNPKILKTLTQDTGIKLGDPLIADGTGGLSYVAMVRHNVAAIVKALAGG